VCTRAQGAQNTCTQARTNAQTHAHRSCTHIHTLVCRGRTHARTLCRACFYTRACAEATHARTPTGVGAHTHALCVRPASTHAVVLQPRTRNKHTSRTRTRNTHARKTRMQPPINLSSCINMPRGQWGDESGSVRAIRSPQGMKCAPPAAPTCHPLPWGSALSSYGGTVGGGAGWEHLLARLPRRKPGMIPRAIVGHRLGGESVHEREWRGHPTTRFPSRWLPRGPHPSLLRTWTGLRGILGARQHAIQGGRRGSRRACTRPLRLAEPLLGTCHCPVGPCCAYLLLSGHVDVVDVA